MNSISRVLAPITIFLLVLGWRQARGDTLHVPSEYPTIREAIEFANDKDVVLIEPGVYHETIDFLGKQITVRGNGGFPSAVEIDGSAFARSVVMFTSGETEHSRLENLRVAGGRGTTIGSRTYGGAVLILNASPTIVECQIYESTADHGGGLYVEGGAPTIINTSVFDNEAEVGGGLYAIGMNATFHDLRLIANRANYLGGGMYLDGVIVQMTRCTVRDNSGESGAGAYMRLSNAIVDGCWLMSNIASGYAGAFYVDDRSSIAMRGTFVLANRANTGAGVKIDDTATVTELINCEFLDNISDLAGALQYGSTEPLVIQDCRFIGNSQGCYFYGEGHLVRCEFAANAPLGGANLASGTVRDCSFQGNQWAGSGGALTLDGPGRISDCLFSDNRSSTTGGAVFLDAREGPIDVERCLFLNNLSSETGGALGCNEGDITVRDCRFDGNGSYLGGGAIWEGDRTVFDRCVFARNWSWSEGGAIELTFTTSSRLTNCLFIANRSERWGGAIALSNLGLFEALTIQNCTMYANSAPLGGAIYTGANDALALVNCIVYGSGVNPILSTKPMIFNVEYSLIQGGYPGVGNIDADPSFINPESDDLRIRAGSPCIDAGDADALPPDTEADLDGQLRFVDDPLTPDTGRGSPVVDMGCYEYQLDGPGSAFTLSVTPIPLNAGENGTFSVQNATPSAATYLIYSTDGPGLTPVKQLQVTLDLLRPHLAGSPRIPDKSGACEWTIRIPAQHRGRPVWFQSAQSGRSSNLVSTRIE